MPDSWPWTCTGLSFFSGDLSFFWPGVGAPRVVKIQSNRTWTYPIGNTTSRLYHMVPNLPWPQKNVGGVPIPREVVGSLRSTQAQVHHQQQQEAKVSIASSPSSIGCYCGLWLTNYYIIYIHFCIPATPCPPATASLLSHASPPGCTPAVPGALAAGGLGAGGCAW